jgi:hypothetical protein
MITGNDPKKYQCTAAQIYKNTKRRKNQLQSQDHLRQWIAEKAALLWTAISATTTMACPTIKPTEKIQVLMTAGS